MGTSTALVPSINRVCLYTANLLLVKVSGPTGEPDRPTSARVPIHPAWSGVLLARTPWIPCALHAYFSHRYLRRLGLLRLDGGKKSRTSISRALASFSSIVTVGLMCPFSIRLTVTKPTPASSASWRTE